MAVIVRPDRQPERPLLGESGMAGMGRKADFPHSGTPMAIADTTLRRQNDDEMEMRMPFKSHDRAATGA